MTNLQKQAEKCIRCAIGRTSKAWKVLAAGLVAALCLLMAHTASAQSGTAARPQPPLQVLDDRTPLMGLRGAGLAWVDTNGDTTLQEILARGAQLPFVPWESGAIAKLGPQGALWVHLRVARNATSRQNWLIDVPLPWLDRVTVYQNTLTGWAAQTAGDRVAMSEWPEPGRYPQFTLRVSDTNTHDVYIRLQNQTALNVPINLATRRGQSQSLQLEYLGIGLAMGALFLLIVACAVQSHLYRDRAYGWYAAYASIMALVVAAWTGVAGHWLWGDFPAWNDMAQGCLGMLAGGSALLVLHHLCGAETRLRHFELVTRWVGLAGLPLALAYAVLPRQIAVYMLGAYLVAAVLLGTSRSFLSWRRRDPVGLWVLLGFTPLAVATLVIIASVMGLTPVSWATRYGLIAGLTIEVPLLLVALNLRSRERHAVQAREQAMASHDALTGLLAPHIFNDRFRQVVNRARRHHQPAAVIYIELVNHGYIKKNWGTAVAEQSLLRSVIKLRRILSDAHTVGRIDEARFGVILEGESSRRPATELAARLIAAGLMPLPGLKPEVVLQFHAAGVMLAEHDGDREEIDEALTLLLYQMGSRTRRPIRFLEAATSRPVPAESGFENTAPPTQVNPAGHVPQARSGAAGLRAVGGQSKR